MSRSKKHNPFHGIAGCSNKQDKRFANRRLRRKTTAKLRHTPEDADILPVMREVSDPWGMAKDGKMRFDPEEFPKLMRK